MERRRIGTTDLFISPVAMGCWPITGITSAGVTEAHSFATLQAAADGGINFFDTAHMYGYDGESERLIAKALGHRRKEIIIATKGGLHWESPGKVACDASPSKSGRMPGPWAGTFRTLSVPLSRMPFAAEVSRYRAER